MLRSLNIRHATDEEGADIEHILFETNLCPHGHDFSRVYPSWIIAELRGVICGCIQVLIGFPLGHIGFVAVLPGYQNLGIGPLLGYTAERLLGQMGCDGYTGMSSNPQVLKRAQRKRAIIFGDPVEVLFKRVPRKKESKSWEVNQENQSQ